MHVVKEVITHCLSFNLIFTLRIGGINKKILENFVKYAILKLEIFLLANQFNISV